MTMEAIESYEHAGCTIELHYDDDPMSPREWSQLGTIITWGRERGWGDEDLRYEPDDTDYSTIRWAVRIRREREATVVVPVVLADYGSSGTRIYVTDSWEDANAVIIDTPEGREMTGVLPEHVRDVLCAEIDEMAMWAAGEVYGYVVEKKGEVLDSCWGFVGDDGLREAKNQAEGYAEDEERAEAQVGFYSVAH